MVIGDQMVLRRPVFVPSVLTLQAVTYCTVYQWCVTAFSSGLWNIPMSIDQVLDGCIVKAHVKIDALRKQQWHENSIQGRNPGTYFTAVSPRTIGNHLLAAGLIRVPLARLPLIP